MNMEVMLDRVRVSGRETALDFARLGYHLTHESRDPIFVNQGMELSLDATKHAESHPMLSAMSLMAAKWLFGIASRMAYRWDLK